MHTMTTLLSQLTEAERAQAMARFQLIRPFLEGQLELAAIAQHHSLSRRTLRRKPRHDFLSTGAE
jgi:transcriptional regulator GlxA family with amidase domain